MNDAKEKDASLLPGMMTESTFIELCAAMRDVDVTYSPRKIGASTTCSARDITLDIAHLKMGVVTVVPPKNV
jgi:hypothetical protein